MEKIETAIIVKGAAIRFMKFISFLMFPKNQNREKASPVKNPSRQPTVTSIGVCPRTSFIGEYFTISLLFRSLPSSFIFFA